MMDGEAGEAGVLLRPAIRIFNGRKPLHALCCDTNQPMPALLMVMLRGGAKVNEMDCRGQQPIHYAIRRGSAQCVRKLLEFGAHLHLRDSALKCPLHIAAQLPNPRVAQMLLHSGAFPNTPDLDGCQPLHYAAAFVRPDTVRVLLNYAASPAVKSVQGVTPLGVACQMRTSLIMLTVEDAAVIAAEEGDEVAFGVARQRANSGTLRHLLGNRDLAIHEVDRCIQLLILGIDRDDKSQMKEELSSLLSTGNISPDLCPTRSAPRLTDLCRSVCRRQLRHHLNSNLSSADHPKRPLDAAVAFLPVPKLLRRIILLEDV